MAHTIRHRQATIDIRSLFLRRLGKVWKAGEKLPSIRVVAAELGTAHVSTHRAVKSLTHEGLLIAKPRVGVFVSPRIDQLLRKQMRDSVAITSPHVERPLAGLKVAVIHNVRLQDPFVVPLYESLRTELEPHGCILKSIDGTSRRVWNESVDVSAVAFLQPLFNSIKLTPGQPAVIAGTDNAIWVEPGHGFDIVTVEQELGGSLAGSRLREVGCNGVCVLARGSSKEAPEGSIPGLDRTSSLRLSGFQRGWGQQVSDSHVFRLESYDPMVGADAVQKYLSLQPRPEAVFAASDDLAVGFIYGARGAGLVAGRDYHIIGFDGQDSGRALAGGPLTTVDVPMAEMGRRAAQLLIERMLTPDRPAQRLHVGCSLFDGVTVKTSLRANLEQRNSQ